MKLPGSSEHLLELWSSFSSFETQMMCRQISKSWNVDFSDILIQSLEFKAYSKYIWEVILGRCSQPPLWKFIKDHRWFEFYYYVKPHDEEDYAIEDYDSPHNMDRF